MLKRIVEKLKKIMLSTSEKYLQKTVPDAPYGKIARNPSLDSTEEAAGITSAILQQYVDGKISYQRAMRRLNFLITTVIPKSKLSTKEKQRAKKIVEEAKLMLQALKDPKVKRYVLKLQTGKRRKSSKRKR